jgi:hypothetical protein
VQTFFNEITRLNGKRPGLERAIEFAQKGDVIAVTRPYRLARSTREVLALIDRLLQHLKQIAGALSGDHPARMAAKAVIVAEVERLHWRTWSGKAKNARKSIGRIRAVMSHFQGDAGGRKCIAPSRKLWTALHPLDGYLTGQSAWLAIYAECHRTSSGVGTALTEGTANFLVNRRMNKAQQMRSARRGADLLLQVRCASALTTIDPPLLTGIDPLTYFLPTVSR